MKRMRSVTLKVMIQTQKVHKRRQFNKNKNKNHALHKKLNIFKSSRHLIMIKNPKQNRLSLLTGLSMRFSHLNF